MSDRCKNCIFAELDQTLINLGYRKKLVIGCKNGCDIDAEECEAFEKSCDETKKKYLNMVGDEIRHKEKGTLGIVVNTHVDDSIYCVLEDGREVTLAKHQVKYWKKTGRNFKAIVGLYEQVSSKVRSLSDRPIGFYYKGDM